MTGTKEPQETTDTSENTTKHVFVPLSMELMDIPKDELCKVFEQFDTALKARTFMSLRDKDQRFKLTYTDLKGNTREHEHPEEYVTSTPQWAKWLEEQRVASLFHLMKVRNDFSITAEMLTTKPHLLDKIASMRIDALKAKPQPAAAKPQVSTEPKPGRNRPSRSRTRQTDTQAQTVTSEHVTPPPGPTDTAPGDTQVTVSAPEQAHDTTPTAPAT